MLRAGQHDPAHPMTYIRPRAPLDRMLAGIAEAARAAEADRPAAIAAAIAAEAARPDLLDGRDCPCSPDRYIRHLLAENRDQGYAVVALVWRPGQMSPVHAHRTWCAFGAHAGVLTETFYAPGDAPGDPPRPTATRLLAPGGTGHAAAGPQAIHRIANLGCGRAVSIHCYGVTYDRFGDSVNEVLSA